MRNAGRWLWGAIGTFVLTASLLLLPAVRADAQQWIGGFYRDTFGALYVTCEYQGSPQSCQGSGGGAGAPLPGASPTPQGPNQAIGVSYNDGAGHEQPVTPNTGLPTVVENPGPLGPHGYPAFEFGANASAPPTPTPATSFACTGTSVLATANTDLFAVQASSSKVVRIRKVLIGATSTTAGTVTMNAVLRSTLDTGGTPTTITPVPLDSTNASPTATCLLYTAAPTAGTLIGTIFSWMQNYIVATNGATQGISSPLEGLNVEQAPTLRNNTTQQFSVQVGPTPAPGTPAQAITVVFTEDPT